MPARVLVPALSGLLLAVAAVISWWVSPVLTAVLVGLAVIVMSVWQWYRRRHDVPAGPATVWTTIVWPVTYGCVAVTALNGWIYRVSADSGSSEASSVRLLVGLVTGVIGMAAAYGYGRVRAQKAQVAEQHYGGSPADEADDEPDDEWFFPQAR
ncbi:MAG: hypothetical protein QM658_12700 [Gordonia sp. (in: high G+C Gram-positive bacteria)]